MIQDYLNEQGMTEQWNMHSARQSRTGETVIEVIQMNENEYFILCESGSSWIETLQGTIHILNPEQTQKTIVQLYENNKILYESGKKIEKIVKAINNQAKQESKQEHEKKNAPQQPSKPETNTNQ